MQITGLFLAQHAAIVDRKLVVVGGVLDWIEAPRTAAAGTELPAGQTVAPYYVVTLMQTEPADHQQPYPMTLELVDAEGTRRVLAQGDVVVDARNGENRFLVTPVGVAAAQSGPVTVHQTIEGVGSMSFPLRINVLD